VGATVGTAVGDAVGAAVGASLAPHACLTDASRSDELCEI
jgi:hypothetical protein